MMAAIDRGPGDRSQPVLVTGANGFIGTRVVDRLLTEGFECVKGFVRPSSDLRGLGRLLAERGSRGLHIVKGNLQSRDDCRVAVDGVARIIHLAAGRGEKSYPDAYSNSVVTTRNLLDAAAATKRVRRFVNVSSLCVYSTEQLRAGAVLDESCPLEASPHRSGEPYCYAKVRQDELVREYATRHGIPWVNLRPGVVYGPGNAGISGRVGIGTFGVFLHLGGGNRLPLTYVDNCAEAIVTAALAPDAEGETFNVIDDELPTSRQFLKLHKRRVRDFPSIYVPRPVSRIFCAMWEAYSTRSQGQLPSVFTRQKWARYWKGHAYSNAKLKQLGWRPRVGFAEGSAQLFAEQRSVRT